MKRYSFNMAVNGARETARVLFRPIFTEVNQMTSVPSVFGPLPIGSLAVSDLHQSRSQARLQKEERVVILLVKNPRLS